MDTAKFFGAIVRAFKLAFQIIMDQFIDIDGIMNSIGSLGSLVKDNKEAEETT